MSEDDHIRAEFERRGVARVRDQLGRNEFNPAYRALAVEWLAVKDDARSDEQLSIMRSSKNAAWAAAIAAAAAVLVALIALFASHK